MGLRACTDVNVITTCPPAGSQLLLFNVAGQANGMALIGVDTFKCCLTYELFGVGIITITGANLDVDNKYINTGLAQSLLVYGSGVPDFLQYGTEWTYVFNSAGRVEGVEILLPFTDTDRFILFPNPSCTALPAGEIPEGINETLVLTGENTYVLDWNLTRRTKYGTMGHFEVWQKNPLDVYEPTAIQPTFVGENPTEFIFELFGVDSIIVIS